MIPYGHQSISEADIEAVVGVLRSDWLTQGPAVPAFEEAVSARTGAAHAVAVNSGTSALHIACLALELGPEDWLWTVPNTFVASANCGRYCGASIDFVDIDPLTWNLSVPLLAEKLAQAKKDGRLPRVLVPVHFAGQPTDQEAIWNLAQEYGFKVLEDASHSIGASRNGEPVGSCRWSDIAVLSFHPVKIITSGEGGMALTNDGKLTERMRMLRTHGITRDRSAMDGASEGAWYYQQVELGFNYRATDVQCALGASQMARLDEFVARRRAIAARYSDAFAGLPLTVQWQHPDAQSAWHLYVVRLHLGEIRKTRREVFDELRGAGIGVNVHYIPVHLQPYYRRLGFCPGDFPEAERYYAEALTLPLFPSLSEADQETVIDAVQSATGGP